jgi:hypothetical protein
MHERHGDGPERSFFISYTREDEAYVRRLAERLSGSGLPLWYDHDLSLGERFPAKISAKIRTALAVVVVMSPTAEKSRWGEREILEGERYDREFAPVLLRGKRFFLLNAIQCFDARQGNLPGDWEIAQFRRLMAAATDGYPLPSLNFRASAHERTAEAPREVPRHDSDISLRKLCEFLKEDRIEHADIVTTSILLGSVGRTGDGFLQPADRESIPLRLLAEIDAAWSRSSLGKYGFRAQLQLQGGPPAGVQPGKQRDFFALAKATGWVAADRSATPRYGKFVGSENWPAGFFPTLRHPPVERLSSWYDYWMQTVMAVHLRLREWSAQKT